MNNFNIRLQRYKDKKIINCELSVLLASWEFLERIFGQKTVWFKLQGVSRTETEEKMAINLCTGFVSIFLYQPFLVKI